MKILLKDNLINTIKKSTGSRMFQNFYVDDNGAQKDILENGQLSCAFFVSSILKQFNLIDEIHTTVDGVIDDLGENWIQVSVLEAEPGDILVWEKDGIYGHIGFALEDNQAISNSTSKRMPHQHSQDFDGTRLVSQVFRYIKKW